APPAHGHDEGLAEHAAKIAEGAGQRMVAHADAWPNLPEELLLGHHAIAVLDEMGKQIERLARNRDGRAPSSKLESFEVESEPSETDNGADGTAHLAFSRPTAGPRWIFPVHSGNSRSVTKPLRSRSKEIWIHTNRCVPPRAATRRRPAPSSRPCRT